MISCDYIQGFADADGGISGWTIILTNTESLLIERIKRKLEACGIKSTLRRHDRPTPYLPYFRLRITGYKNLKRFQRYINFGHPRKRQALAEYITKMERPGTLYNWSQANMASTLRSLGHSYGQIAKKLGIGKNTLSMRFRRGLWPLKEI